LQVLQFSNDQDHTDGLVERCSTGEEAIGDDSNVFWLHALSVSHGVAQVIHSQVASQGTGLLNVCNADMAMAMYLNIYIYIP
jgi:hypothetical protein